MDILPNLPKKKLNPLKILPDLLKILPSMSFNIAGDTLVTNICCFLLTYTDA